MKKTLIIGATSMIAQATARLFAEAGYSLYLVARNQSKLEAVADDLKVRGAEAVHTANLDVLDYSQHKVAINAAINTLDGLDLVLIAHGTLPEQKACEQSFDLTQKEFGINTLSTISLLTYLANYFEDKGQGTIAVISSVAGDRGRQSNYVYGSAKGTVTLYLQGLRNRLHKSNVNVITVKPGFVDTPMTSGMNKGLLWAKPEKIADTIFRAIDRRRDVVYAPWFWRYIMLIIRMIPELLFKRLNL
ncbi:MAG: SDR family oxidoreductase [Gammaproteobacteria bacterium]|nr:SDR family oxidoreductase [Gammaproteobacteria bacterium]